MIFAIKMLSWRTLIVDYHTIWKIFSAFTIQNKPFCDHQIFNKKFLIVP